MNAGSFTRVVAALVACGVTAVTASAQTRPSTPSAAAAPKGPGHQFEFVAGVTFQGSTSFGSHDVSLKAPDGSNFFFANTSTSRSPGIGIDGQLGIRLTSRLRVEASGAWIRDEFRTNVSSDIEGAPAITASETASQLSLEGAAVWSLARRRKTEYFVRGSAGWSRELSGGVVLWNGVVGSAGGGVKYWWRETARGAIKRLGLRIDGRVTIRSTGLAASARTVHLVPSVTGAIAFGF